MYLEFVLCSWCTQLCISLYWMFMYTDCVPAEWGTTLHQHAVNDHIPHICTLFLIYETLHQHVVNDHVPKICPLWPDVCNFASTCSERPCTQTLPSVFLRSEVQLCMYATLHRHVISTTLAKGYEVSKMSMPALTACNTVSGLHTAHSILGFSSGRCFWTKILLLKKFRFSLAHNLYSFPFDTEYVYSSYT